MSRTLASAAFVTACLLSGCSGLEVKTGGDVAADPGGLDGDEIENELHKFRDAAKEHPGEYESAHEFANFATDHLEKKDTDLDEAALAAEALRYLDAVGDADDHRHDALADKADLLHAVGDNDGALEAYRASLALKPSMHLIPGMLIVLRGDKPEMSAVCKAIRAEVSTDKDVLTLMKSCKKSGDALSWASDADQALFDKNPGE